MVRAGCRYVPLHWVTTWCSHYITLKLRDRNTALQHGVTKNFALLHSVTTLLAKIQLFKSYCYPIYRCALWRHSFQNSIRKLTVSYSDTFKRLINVKRYASSSLAFAMNATDHINVVFRKFSYSLMSRVIASPNSIVTAIVNSNANPLMDKLEIMLYVRIDHR